MTPEHRAELKAHIAQYAKHPSMIDEYLDARQEFESAVGVLVTTSAAFGSRHPRTVKAQQAEDALRIKQDDLASLVLHGYTVRKKRP